MRKIHKFFLLSAVVMLAWGFLPMMGAAATCPTFLSGRQVGTVSFASINEASGIVSSRKNIDVLWVHNDSGDVARVFAMNLGGGHLGVYYLSGVSATDWEDIAIGPGPVAGESYLYAGDIGDNSAVRSSVKVYRVPEPAVSSTQTPVSVSLGGVETITLVYPDGARDAETLMVDPLNRDIYVVSKRESKSRVYRAAYPQSTSVQITMDFVAELPWGWATGGEISPTGGEIIIRGYSNASLWSRASGTSVAEAFDTAPCSVPLVSEPQGEAICFDPDGYGYFTVSENSYQPVYYFVRTPPPEPVIEYMRLEPGGEFSICWRSVPTLYYRLLWSADLQSWQDIGDSIAAGSSCRASYTDSGTAGIKLKFYKITPVD